MYLSGEYCAEILEAGAIKSVLVIGLAVVDFLFEVQEMPRSAEKFVATQAGAVGGGGAANAAVTIAHLGGDAKLAARVGDDLFGDIIVKQLQDERVDCSLVQCTAGARSSFSSVLVDHSGERQIVNYRGSGLSDDVSALSNMKVDAVLTDTRWTEGTLAGLTLARALGIPGVIDGEAPANQQALALASHCAFSQQGLAALTGIPDPKAALPVALDHCNGFVCVTDGANGVYYFKDGVVQQVPAFAIDAVDTLGAGDVWHGAFSFSLAERKTEVEAIIFANAAAALKCLKKGGGRNPPSRKEIDDFLLREISI